MEEEVEVKLPKLGESIVSATVVQWFKKEGDIVKLDEPLLEVSTDKVNSEIPSPVSGRIKAIHAAPDEELDVGALIATITTAEITSAASEPQEPKKAEKTATCSSGSSMKSFFTPVVLKIAQEKGVDLEELANIPATGAGGRLSKRDLEKYLTQKGQKPSPTFASTEQIERMKMTGMRKMIAENMVRSFYEAPHATLVNEVDITKVVKFIALEKESFLKKHGYKLSITSFIAKAIASAVKEFPLINSSLDGDTIVVKRFVNLGIAVSVEQGILVPVIQNCQGRTIPDIAKEVAALSEKARSNRLDPNQVKEGTITMTNFGMSGTLIGVPIIRYPEVAIVGVGAIQKKVVALDDDTMAIRSMLHLSLTFDHRVIDGMYGCGFLAAVKQHLEQDISL
jgi:2-oxoglutarate dehydrogenase E2 component (dihydrolipoamide succinyltransferase)